MLETFDKTIGKHTYRVTQLDAITGRKVLMRLVRLAAPALEKAGKVGAEDDNASGAAAIAALMGNLSDADVEFFCNTFAPNTVVTGGRYAGNEPSLDREFTMHFAGNYGEMLHWLIFCVTVNFGSFFGEAGSLLKSAPAKA